MRLCRYAPAFAWFHLLGPLSSQLEDTISLLERIPCAPCRTRRIQPKASKSNNGACFLCSFARRIDALEYETLISRIIRRVVIQWGRFELS